MCIGVRAHVYTCVYVPMYTCVGVCAHVFICVMYMPICTWVWAYMPICTCVAIHAHLYMSVGVHAHLYIYVDVHVLAYMCVVYMSMCTCVWCACSCVHECGCACSCVHVEESTGVLFVALYSILLRWRLAKPGARLVVSKPQQSSCHHLPTHRSSRFCITHYYPRHPIP